MLNYTLHSDDNLDDILYNAKVRPDSRVQGLKPVLSILKDGRRYSLLNQFGICTCVSYYKGGKTTWIWHTSGLVAKAIASDFFESHLQAGDRIGLFDTEEGQLRCQLKVNRLFPVEYDVAIDVFSLRHVPTVDLLPIIERYVIVNRPKLIALDICSDLVTNANDIDQSNYVVNKLAELAEKHSTHVLCSIHLSRNGEATGHLGSALLKRSDLVVRLKRIDDVNCVFPQYARDEPFPPYGFKIQNGKAVLIDSIPSSSRIRSSRFKKSDFDEVPSEKHRDVLSLVYMSKEAGLRPGELKQKLKTHYGEVVGEIGEVLLKRLQKYYLDQQLLEKREGLIYLAPSNVGPKTG